MTEDGQTETLILTKVLLISVGIFIIIEVDLIS